MVVSKKCIGIGSKMNRRVFEIYFLFRHVYIKIIQENGENWRKYNSILVHIPSAASLKHMASLHRPVH